MKKIIIISFLLISVIVAQDLRQQENGFSLYLGSVNSSLLNTSSISKINISGGIDYKWHLPHSLSISSGLFYVEKGFKKNSNVIAFRGFFLDQTYKIADINSKYFYIEIPLLLNYNFKLSNSINLKVGTGISWLINTNQVDHLENGILIDTSNLSEEEFKKYPYDYSFDEDPGDLSPESSTYDFNVSLSLEWLKYFVHLKYSQNISEGVTTFSLADFRKKLKTWGFYVGYMF